MSRETTVMLFLALASCYCAAVEAVGRRSLRATPAMANDNMSNLQITTGPVDQPTSLEGGVNPVLAMLYNGMELTTVDGMPMYNYTTSVMIRNDLPEPAGPQDCNPGRPAFAPDNSPYIESRTWDFTTDTEPGMPADTKLATGFDTYSVSYLSCGHPPENFLIPHFDLHWYYADPSKRAEITCGSPHPLLCFIDGNDNPNLFEYPEGGPNMPEGFTWEGLPIAVKGMGLHWWKPLTTTSWEEVSMLMGSYDSEIVFWELMIPAHKVSGGSARNIQYKDQNMPYLPYGYDLTYTKGSDGNIMTASLFVPANAK